MNINGESQKPGTAPNAQSELLRINQELYTRNLELVVRNRTLSTQQKIYDIINTSLGVKETARRMLEGLVTENMFKYAAISLIDHQDKTLQIVATTNSQMESPSPELTHITGAILKAKIPLSMTDNLSIQAILNKKVMVSNSLYDSLKPIVNITSANAIQSALGVKSIVIYPLTFGSKVLGVLSFTKSEEYDNASEIEKNVLDGLRNVIGIAIERAQVYSNLQSANRHLKQLDKLKDELVSSASHELRTPLAIMKNYIWMALHKSTTVLDATTKNYLEIAMKSCDRLTFLVADMLTASRIEAHRLNLHITKFNICELIKQITTEYKLRAEEQKLTLEFAQDNECMEIMADRDKIHEVVTNLTGNALKFTPPNGKIEIFVHTIKGHLEVSIKDTGPGIAAKDFPRLFKKFGRVDESYKYVPQTSGTGLGLYISQNIAKMHKGKINIASEIGKGSTFTLVLPLQDVS